VAVSSLAADGEETILNKIKLPRDGSPWQLPSTKNITTGKSLSDLGWQGKVGAVVPHRWTDRVIRSASWFTSVDLDCSDPPRRSR
jgi:adenine-specific DNA-methyltransferase